MHCFSTDGTDLSPNSLGMQATGGGTGSEYGTTYAGGSVRSQQQGWMNTLSNRSTMSKRSSGGTGGMYKYKSPNFIGSDK